LKLFLLAVVVLSLNTHDDSDGAINGKTIDPTMGWLLDCLDDDIDGTEDEKELEGAIL
jgi:hypothetical protein